MGQKPSIGRIVHYTPTATIDGDDKGPLAAIVVDVETSIGNPGMVNLTIFRRSGFPESRIAVNYSEAGLPGTWSWPPRV